MKFPGRLALLLAALPVAAFAHPGHDDGHEVTWEFSHLAAHPLATLGCLAVLATGAWLVWRLTRRPDADLKRVRTDRSR